MRVPELLAPAGGWEQLETALLYGADAIYLSGPDLSLRTARSGFDAKALEAAGKLTRRHGKRYYYCLNLLALDADLPAVEARLEQLAAMDEGARPHGLIVADPGVMRLAQRLAPQLPVHVSTQANTTNAETLRLWRDLGATRANLARELDGKAIAALAAAGLEMGMDTECFVQGAQCLAISGRCLLSMALNRRHANQGRCTLPCRFEYRSLFLEEKQRSGEALWEVETLAGGCGAAQGRGQAHSAIYSCEDLCLLPYLGWFAFHGVSAVKVEGRTRSGGALAPVLDAYATALAGLGRGAQPTGSQLAEVFTTATRPLGTGFFLGERQRLWTSTASRRPVAARLERPNGDDAWEIAVRGPLDASHPLEALLPGLCRPVFSPGAYSLESPAGARLQQAHSGQQAVLRLHAPTAPDSMGRENAPAALLSGCYLRQAIAHDDA